MLRRLKVTTDKMEKRATFRLYDGSTKYSFCFSTVQAKTEEPSNIVFATTVLFPDEFPDETILREERTLDSRSRFSFISQFSTS